MIFTVVATFAQGLSATWDTFKAGFAGRGQSLSMLLIAKVMLVPVLVIALTAIVPFDKQVNMATCVVALAMGAPFIPWVTRVGHGKIAYAASVSLLLTVLTFVLLSLPAALKALDTGADVVRVP